MRDIPWGITSHWRMFATFLVLIGASGFAAPPVSSSLPTVANPPQARLEALSLTPEQRSRLDALITQDRKTRQSIEYSSPSLEVCDQRFRSWQRAPRPAEELSFILRCAETALAMDPIDWSTYQQAIGLLNFGSKSPAFVTLACRVVESPPPIEMSVGQYTALLDTMRAKGRQQQPGAEEHLLRWAGAAFWSDRSADCLLLQDEGKVLSLRQSAILGLHALPEPQAVKSLKRLREEISEDAGAEDQNSPGTKKRLLRMIERAMDDIALQTKNKPPTDISIRGYYYQGPGAKFYVD